MNHIEEDEFGSIEATHRLWLFFNKQVQLLEHTRLSDQG